MATYKVKSGDTLSAIAIMYNTTVSEIQKANKTLISDPNRIDVGWVLTIPEHKTSNDEQVAQSEIVSLINQCMEDVENLPSYKKLAKLMVGKSKFPTEINS